MDSGPNGRTDCIGKSAEVVGIPQSPKFEINDTKLDFNLLIISLRMHLTKMEAMTETRVRIDILFLESKASRSADPSGNCCTCIA